MAVLSRGIEYAHQNEPVLVLFMYSNQIFLSRGFSYQQTDSIRTANRRYEKINIHNKHMKIVFDFDCLTVVGQAKRITCRGKRSLID